MKTGLKETSLPNGLKVFCLDELEATLVFDQVKLYYKHGIEVHPADTVFDIGANIGMFTLLTNELGDRNINIFAFEPIPDIFAALSANINRHGTDIIRVFNCGLAANSGSTEFAYYPHYTMLSTAYSDSTSENELHTLIRESLLRNLDELPRQLHWLRWLPGFLRSFVLDRMIDRSFRDMQLIKCQLRTVSEIIREYNVEHIDLLKVDAEKSELAVLGGVDEEHWPMIRQVVMEVHDLEGRLEAIRQLLKKHGIAQIMIEQEPTLRGSNVYSLYARRA